MDPEHTNTADLGRAFPLTGSSYAYIQHGGLFQETGDEVLVDTGCPIDGELPSHLFRQEVREQQTQPSGYVKEGVLTNADPGILLFSKCLWAGNTYTNLVILEGRPNLIGLMFMARHLVTFDFPRRVMYLKQTSVGPLVDENLDAAKGFLHNLKEKGQLLGWSKDAKGEVSVEPASNAFIFTIRRDGDSFIYH
ncbi:MAG: hypothetical protein ACLQSR_17760 [Limisphaerales bacterium]